MPKSPKLSQTYKAYQDVRAMMEYALDHSGTTYTLPTVGKAQNFVHRCNRYRMNLRKAVSDDLAALPGLVAESKYDTLAITRDGRVITFVLRILEGTIVGPDGKPVTLTSDETTVQTEEAAMSPPDFGILEVDE